MADSKILDIVIKARDEASATFKNLSKQVQSSGDEAEKSTSKFSSMWGQFAIGSLAASGVTAAVNAAEGQFGSLFAAADEHAQSLAQLNSVIKASGDASGYTSEQAQQLAENMQKSTPISRDATIQAEDMLMTFAGIGKGAFGGATKAVADMATAMNGGAIPSADQMRQTAIQVGKALNDPAHGMSKLTREGVVFTAQQQEQIKAMSKVGNVAGAQNVMLQALNTNFGGSAQAAAGTYAGKIQMMKNNIDDAKTAIGNAIETAIKPFAAGLASFVSSDTFKNWVKDVAKFIEDLSKWIQTATKYYEEHKRVINTIAGILAAIGGAILIVVGTIRTVTTVMEIWDGIMTLIAATNPIILAITVIIAIGLLLITHWKEVTKVAGDMWKGVTKFFADMGKSIGDIVGGVINFIKAHWDLLLDILLGPLGFIVGEIIKHWNQIKKGFVDAWNGAVNFVKGIPGDILNALGDVGKLLFNAGKNIIQGLINGVKNVAHLATDAVKNVGKSVVDGFKNLLGIHSPSTIFHELGQNIGQGLANGVVSTAGLVTKATSNLVNIPKISSASTAINSPVGVSSAVGSAGNGAVNANTTSGSGPVNITVNIGVYAGTQTEKQKIAIEMWQSLMQVARTHNLATNIPNLGIRPV